MTSWISKQGLWVKLTMATLEIDDSVEEEVTYKITPQNDTL